MYMNASENRKGKKQKPTMAPAMNTHDELEQRADEQEVEQGDYTRVTRLFLDRTPKE